MRMTVHLFVLPKWLFTTSSAQRIIIIIIIIIMHEKTAPSLFLCSRPHLPN